MWVIHLFLMYRNNSIWFNLNFLFFLNFFKSYIHVLTVTIHHFLFIIWQLSCVIKYHIQSKQKKKKTALSMEYMSRALDNRYRKYSIHRINIDFVICIIPMTKFIGTNQNRRILSITCQVRNDFNKKKTKIKKQYA